jgi:nucleoside-diphosphate-sugar epimerase
MHGSLLPKYRGRVPVNWAIIHGERETGATLHGMVEKPDAGGILAQQAVPILPDDTAFEVFNKVTLAAEIALDRVLPELLAGRAVPQAQNLSAGSYFGGRKAEDGRIDWTRPAAEIHNLIRAVAPPYPGAFCDTARGRLTVLRSLHPTGESGPHGGKPTLFSRDGKLYAECGDGRLLRLLAVELSGSARVAARPATSSTRPSALPSPCHEKNPHPRRQRLHRPSPFPAHHEHTDWEVYGMDMNSERVTDLMDQPALSFLRGRHHHQQGVDRVSRQKCDVILPLVAIATPATYVKEPLRVFELDFEANLPIVRQAVKYKKRVIFPSTSEVYGMSQDPEFDPENSPLIYGPINKPRWIYACAKQMMDRVIHAYGQQEGLQYTLFRPFNWIGPGLDSIHTPKEGSSRVITQFLGHIVRGEPIKLVDGGAQKRSFTYVTDGIDALMKIIENKDGIANGKIYNIGNPRNNYSIRELATLMLDLARQYPEYAESVAKVKVLETTSAEYYGKGYQDTQHRVPKIANTMADLNWEPKVKFEDALRGIFEAYRGDVAEARKLMD